MTPRIFAYRKLSDARRHVYQLVFAGPSSTIDRGEFYRAMSELERASKAAAVAAYDWKLRRK